MIQDNLLNFLNSPHLFDQLNEKNAYVKFEKGSGWKVVHLGKFEWWMRKLFGCFGYHKATHQKYVAQALRNELKNIVTFDEEVKNVKSMIRIAHAIQKLQNVGNEINTTVADAKIDTFSPLDDREKFKRTLAFIEKNDGIFQEMKKEGISFKIKSDKASRLSVKVSAENVAILTRKILGEGGFKHLKTAYDVDKHIALARAIMVIKRPRMNWLVHLVMARSVRNELMFLEKVKGDPTCIQLTSSYAYVGKRGQHKVVMLMELADGDLFKLMAKNLTKEERYDIASQLIDALVALSKKNIWHRDLKPLNFLYFVKEGKYKIVVADFGLSAPDRDFYAEKFVGGTYGYMPPENYRFFRLQNGKEGDIYSMGKILSELLPIKDRSDFMSQLIREMRHENPKKRPTAEEIQQRFKANISRIF